MAAPKGIFVGDSMEELQAELVLAKERARSGDRTALSGAGKSSSRSFSLSAEDYLREVRYALGLLQGTGLARRTVFDARTRFSL